VQRMPIPKPIAVLGAPQQLPLFGSGVVCVRRCSSDYVGEMGTSQQQTHLAVGHPFT
jgi:hypothetical protein